MKEKTNMKMRMLRPTTARRLRKKRLATSAPGDRTLTRGRPLREKVVLLPRGGIVLLGVLVLIVFRRALGGVLRHTGSVERLLVFGFYRNQKRS